MRFQVPQFIEVENKIFGPLTFRQFVYIVGGVGLVVILWTLLPNFLAIIIGLPILVFAAMLAFYKVNGKPFSYMVEAFIKFYLSNRLYVWKKKEKEITPQAPQKTHKAEVNVRTTGGRSKLKDLSWNLDVSNQEESK